MAWHSQTALKLRFADLMSRPDEELDLAEGAFLLAAEEYPALDVAVELGRLDALAERACSALPQDGAPGERAAALAHWLFGAAGFRGNAVDYHDPRNSFLNEVLDRRLGIPISLSVLALEVGRRTGVTLEGVGLPGHFLVRAPDPEARVFDPFHSGVPVPAEGCERLMRRALGPGIALRPDMLETVGSRRILARMLNNLRGIYVRRGDRLRALSCVDRLVVTEPWNVDHLRDRGLLHLAGGGVFHARPDLEQWLAATPEGSDRAFVEAQLQRAVARSRTLN